eukprot:GFUD01057876.1.p1 GENE.GFUD01057876.1~~GFUD01057876.1.p1  ORF type:complete len:264 (-),score=61.67 GFUD01057876.1:70-861(-)
MLATVLAAAAMAGGDLFQLLESLISKEWFRDVLVMLIVSLVFVVLVLGLCTNLLHRFGIDLLHRFFGIDAKLTFTEKMKSKSNKIVEAAEHGEKKQTIENCKKILSSMEATHFKCKIFSNKFEGIEGVENFEKVVENIGKQLKLHAENVEGIKLSALGDSRKRDYLAFECAMKDKGKVRLHTGGYQVIKQSEKIDFQIVLNYMDMSDIILKKLPEKSAENLEKNWFNRSRAVEYQKPDEGEDWNSYFQYTAHKNILKELHDVD